jgi:AraC-like DNA-binding protein/mannose-6-phosphate isomerase-like protein (cupin superfamily)
MEHKKDSAFSHAGLRHQLDGEAAARVEGNRARAARSPWYQKRLFDPSFPFHLWDRSMSLGFSPHWHDALEIAYALKGRFSMIVDGSSYIVEPGNILVINSGLIHSVPSVTNSDAMIIQIGLNLFDQCLIDMRDHVFQKLVFRKKTLISAKDGAVYKRISKLLFSMRREYFEWNQGSRLAIRAGLFELALLFLRDIPEKDFFSKEQIQHSTNHHKLEQIYAYIHSNAADPDISLEQAAEAVFLSKFYFSRFFREQTGHTFYSYLSRVRINLAERYLLETNETILQIAHMSGFNSFTTFNRIFKKYTGVSPSVYRLGKKL